MIFRIAICDDDKNFINTLHTHLTKFSAKTNIELSVDEYDNPNDLLYAYDSPGTYHILFLDVEMPEVNGLMLAEKIRAVPDNFVKIIFTSIYSEYMKDSFNVQAFNYICKPIDTKRLEEILIRTIKHITEEASAILLLKNDEEKSKQVVQINDIIHIKTLSDYRNHVRVTTTKTTFTARETISSLQDRLDSYGFIDPCRGHLVNLFHIHYIKKGGITLTNGETVPLSTHKKKELMKLFTNGFISRIN